MASFDGFPTGTRSVPVPSHLLGSLLEEIDDIAELKCTLRFLWHAAQVKGAPKAVSADTLEADGVLRTALGSPEAVRSALEAAVARRTLFQWGELYLLRTPENLRTTQHLSPPGQSIPTPAGGPARPSIYALYEANVGMLTPMVAEHLRDAENEYPVEWIERAIREAAEHNARSWRYIETVLERWAAEGFRSSEERGKRKYGKPGRHTETASAAEYLRQRGDAR